MNIGVVGLGLIGGSLAKAYRESGHTVYGYDTDEAVFGFAQLSDVVCVTPLDERTIGLCDAVFLCIRPKDTVAWLEAHATDIPAHVMVIDCCGVKRFVCERCFPVAKRHGFTFVGGHPMAGSHNAGFKNSRASLFRGASMILVPPVYDDPALFGRIEDALRPAGFGRLTVTTAEKHDELIAFSSQMAHIVSNAYIKSPSAKAHKGFSAGSYKDLTRVARLDADMWAELMMKNRDFVMQELDRFTNEISRYRAALACGDTAALRSLLEEGSHRKEAVDGR